MGLLSAAFTVSCYTPSNTGATCEEGSLCDNGQPCTDGVCPTMALDAAVAVVDGCATAACAGGQLVGCGQVEVCALGCASGDAAGRAAHCIELKPSNGFTDWSITDGTAAFVVVGDLIVNTDDGAIMEANLGGATIRSAGLGVRDGIYFASTPGGVPSVFAMQNLTIADGAALRFTGASAVVLLIDGDAVLAGRLDVSAGLDPLRPVGPGGGSGGAVVASAGGGCSGGIFGTSDMLSDGGGGGGGMRDKGGDGGSDTAIGGAGGTNCISSDLQPLLGGSGGGTGGAGSSMTSYGFGGHGGGALQLSVRNQLVIATTGIVVASGGGGGGGRFANGSGGGGAGGGTGGGILIEAPVVAASGKIFANGGGGGGGAGNPLAGNSGAPGQESLQPAQGGSGDGGNGGGGGTNIPARNGRIIGNNGGGGGGSAGMIVVRSGNLMLTGPVSPAVRRLPLLTQ